MQAAYEHFHQRVCLLLVLENGTPVPTPILEQTAPTGSTSLARELQVCIGKSVLGVLNKGETTMRIYHVILEADKVNIRSEVKHETITERLRLGKEMSCQATIPLHRKTKAISVPDYLTIVAPA